MGVEILYGVEKSPKGSPCRVCITGSYRRDHDAALFLNVCVGFVEGVVVEMKFVVTELTAQAILIDVRVRDDGQGTRAETVAERSEHDLDVILSEHSFDYTRAIYTGVIMPT